ncbi:MAG: acyl carrier protein [Limisphaerales bacterium]
MSHELELEAGNLRRQLKELMVETLMLQVTPAEIGDDQPLFGPESLGLDSVDALQLVVALEKGFGFRIADSAAAREILRSVATIAQALEKHRDPGSSIHQPGTA